MDLARRTDRFSAVKSGRKVAGAGIALLIHLGIVLVLLQTSFLTIELPPRPLNISMIHGEDVPSLPPPIVPIQPHFEQIPPITIVPTVINVQSAPIVQRYAIPLMVSNAPPQIAPSPEQPAPPHGMSRGAILLDHEKPVYPAISRRLHEQGEVLVGVSIDAAGNVTNANVKHSSGFSMLDDAALEAVRHWRFQPALDEGKPVAIDAEVPVVFSLMS